MQLRREAFKLLAYMCAPLREAIIGKEGWEDRRREREGGVILKRRGVSLQERFVGSLVASPPWF